MAQAPRICVGYQSGTYNITIYDDQHVIVDQFGPKKYTQKNSSEQLLVVKGLRSDFVIGRQYEVQVTVESLGIFHSRRKHFSKLDMGIIKASNEIPPPPHTHTMIS